VGFVLPAVTHGVASGSVSLGVVSCMGSSFGLLTCPVHSLGMLTCPVHSLEAGSCSVSSFGVLVSSGVSLGVVSCVGFSFGVLLLTALSSLVVESSETDSVRIPSLGLLLVSALIISPFSVLSKTGSTPAF